MNKIVIFPFVLLVSLSILGNVHAQTNDRWHQDYEAIKTYMSEAYANLEWAKTFKKLDFDALNEKTKADLRLAKSDEESRDILNRFLATFGDGHLYLREEKEGSQLTANQPTAFDKNAAADTVCSELGFKFKFHRFSLPFDNAPGYKLISSLGDPFPAAVFELENGKKFGVLRIGLFSSDAYLGNCVASWKEFQAGLAAECRSDCIQRFKKSTENRLSAKLAEVIRKLQDRKLDGLLVDIGGNGGGSDWVEPAAHMLSPKTLKSIRFGFIRHPHWVGILERNLKVVLEDLDRKDLTLKQREYLEAAKSSLEQSIQDAKTNCSRVDVWGSVTRKNDCSLLNTTPAYTSGVYEHLPIGEITNLKSKTVLFNASSYKYEESIYKGKLIVLVDSKTASASEYFASLIQTSRSGTVVGEKTFGAGCGYVNGGTRYYLPNSKLRLRMPDCVRYRADGVNEVEGIDPDVQLWSEKDESRERLVRLLNFLSSTEAN